MSAPQCTYFENWIYKEQRLKEKKVHQATAKPSQDMKKEAAKLKRVQDQESSIIEVKKSFRYL